jgi:hypothetical protein
LTKWRLKYFAPSVRHTGPRSPSNAFYFIDSTPRLSRLQGTLCSFGNTLSPGDAPASVLWPSVIVRHRTSSDWPFAKADPAR